MNYLFHLSACSGFDFDLAPPSLDSEGFVHLSSGDQVLRTANRWFVDHSELKLLVLRDDLLQDKLKWEDTHGHGEEFPHYYGPLPQQAIAAVAVMSRDSEGKFCWPEPLAGLRSPLLEPVVREAGVIEPGKRFPEPLLPARCLICFFPEVPSTLEGCRELPTQGSTIGAATLYQIGETVVCCPRFGGPCAAAALEELIALGCKQFLVCGGAGSLLKEQELGHLVLVNEAWRDEGLSHHYLEPAPSVRVSPELVRALQSRLGELGIGVSVGATWTTDALYRETPSRLARRRESGCLTVEMEMASLLAVAEYRGVALGGLLWCGDDLSGKEWDFRDWTSARSPQEKLVELCLELLSGPAPGVIPSGLSHKDLGAESVPEVVVGSPVFPRRAWPHVRKNR